MQLNEGIKRYQDFIKFVREVQGIFGKKAWACLQPEQMCITLYPTDKDAGAESRKMAGVLIKAGYRQTSAENAKASFVKDGKKVDLYFYMPRGCKLVKKVVTTPAQPAKVETIQVVVCT